MTFYTHKYFYENVYFSIYANNDYHIFMIGGFMIKSDNCIIQGCLFIWQFHTLMIDEVQPVLDLV